MLITELKISLQYHNVLNPKLWNREKLKPNIRQALLKFIEAWRQFAKIPNHLVKDIIITGSLCNYNYTDLSDIDVHLVVDRNSLSNNRTFVDEYLQTKKILWTSKYNIKILGHSLEPYAQDMNTQIHSNQGVYSIKKDVWLQKPTKEIYDFKNDKILQQKVKFYMDLINRIISNNMDIDTVDNLKNKLKTMRVSGIQKGGEFSLENLVVKELRNKGYLDKLNKYSIELTNDELSVNE